MDCKVVTNMYISQNILYNSTKYFNYALENSTICGSLMVKSGSLRDNRGGEAHFLEHMLLDFLRIDETYNESKCLKISGKTSFDRTCYYFVCVPEMLTEALFLIKAIINGCYLNKNQFEKIKEKILFEYEQNHAAFRREEAFLQCASAELGANMPIGTLDSIKSMNFDDVEEYFAREYSISNMALSIIGKADYELVDGLMRTSLMFEKKGASCSAQTEICDKYKSVKPTPQTSLMIRLPGHPLTPITEINDSLSLAFVSEILKRCPSQFITCLGITEYTKSRRYISLTSPCSEGIAEIQCYFNSMVYNPQYFASIICDLKERAMGWLQQQGSGSEILRRIEDSFIYNTCLYPIEEVTNRMATISIEYIEYVIKRLLRSKVYFVSDANTKEVCEWGAKCEK